MSRSHGLKNRRFGSNFSKITRPVAAIKSLRFALFNFAYLKYWTTNKIKKWIVTTHHVTRLIIFKQFPLDINHIIEGKYDVSFHGDCIFRVRVCMFHWSYGFIYPAAQSTGSADNTQRAPRCLDAGGYNFGILAEPTDQVLCLANLGECHKDPMEGPASDSVWRYACFLWSI